MPSPPVSLLAPSLPSTIGRYEVVRLLGEGAMGRVLLARDPVLEREVAVKHLREDLKIPRDVREGLLVRMRHEARAAARVAHPNLVVIHDMGEDEAIGLYLVFEYVEGPTLKQRIANDRLSPREVARLSEELGAALTVAHEAGVLHRDIKPENLILARWGGKIADFGIARVPDSTLTHQGGLMGTPAYSAPETFRVGKFSPASDQFSLAASLYEALSGRRAFPGDDAVAVASKIATDPMEPFASDLGLPPTVDEVLARALDRRPDERFPSCTAFGEALAASLRQKGAKLPPDSAPKNDGDSLRSRSLVSSTPRDRSAAEGDRASMRSSVDSPPPRLRRSSSSSDGRSPTPIPPGPVSGALRERKTTQVLIGAFVIIATAVLLIRAALRAAERGPEPAPTSSATSSPTTPAPSARPRPPSSPPRHPRPEPSTARPAPSPVDVKPNASPNSSALSTSAPSASSAPTTPSAPIAPSAPSATEDPPEPSGP